MFESTRQLAQIETGFRVYRVQQFGLQLLLAVQHEPEKQLVMLKWISEHIKCKGTHGLPRCINVVTMVYWRFVRRELQKVHASSRGGQAVSMLLHTRDTSSASKTSLRSKYPTEQKVKLEHTYTGASNLWMQNFGSRYSNPRSGPREHPVTNLCIYCHPCNEIK